MKKKNNREKEIKMKIKPPMPLTRFTLLELLIVIAILVILVSLLLPGLNSARYKALQIKCTGNLKQIYTGLSVYVADSDGYLPFLQQLYNPEPKWAYLIRDHVASPFYGDGGSEQLKGVLFCPVRTSPEQSPWWPAGTIPASRNVSTYRETTFRVSSDANLNERHGGWRNETSALESGKGEKRLDQVLDGSAILVEKDYNSKNSNWNNRNSPARNYERHSLDSHGLSWHLHQNSSNMLMKSGNVISVKMPSRFRINNEWQYR